MKDDLQSLEKMKKVIMKLREETNRPTTRISSMTWLDIKYLWSISRNPKEFKEWLRVKLGW